MIPQAVAWPTTEIRRLNKQRDELLRQLGDLLAALPDLVTEIDYRRQLCREAADAGRERAWSEGYTAAVADMKRIEHDIVRAVRLVGRRAAPGGAVWLAAVGRNDGTEYGGEGLPRVPVPAEVIGRAREAGAATWTA